MVLKRFKDFLNYWYLQYTLNTALYMLEPMEVKIVNTILVATIAIAIYTAYHVILPNDTALDPAELELKKLINEKIEL